MTKLYATTFVRAKGTSALRLKAALRPRDPKMDALVRAVHRSPHFDVATAAAAVNQALAASIDKTHA